MPPGPRPLPLETRKTRGNPQRRPLPDAPGPLPGTLTCPPNFDPTARAMWHQVAAEMTAAGTLGQENALLLERYVVSAVRWREAERHVTEEGAVILTEKTHTPMPNPWLYIARAEGDRLLKLEAEMGRTPSSRGRVTKAPTSAPADEDNPWDRLQALQARGAVSPQKPWESG